MKNVSEIDVKKDIDFMSNFDRILVDFESQVGAKLGPSWTKNRLTFDVKTVHEKRTQTRAKKEPKGAQKNLS